MQQAALKEDDLYYTDAPVGEILRHVREHYRQTLFDVEKALRIRASQIDAIEKSEYEKLPGRVYAIGFVRTYAEYLGLDPDRIVSMFKNQAVDRSQTPVLHFPVAASESRLPSPQVILVCIALLAGLVFGLSYFLKNTANPLSVIEPVPATDIVMEPELDQNMQEIYGPPAPNTLNQSEQ